MKLSLSLAGIAVLALSSLSTPASGAEPHAGARVVSVTGVAWRIDAGGRKAALKADESISADTRVQTGPGAQATLLLEGAAKSAVLVLENADVTVKKLGGAASPEWRLELAKGGVLSQVHNPQKKKNVFSVRARSVVMGVRGTTFYAAAPEGDPKHADLCACNGTIAISGSGGAKQVTGRNHDTQLTLGAGAKSSPKNLASTHTEEQIAVLKKLVGE